MKTTVVDVLIWEDRIIHLLLKMEERVMISIIPLVFIVSMGDKIPQDKINKSRPFCNVSVKMVIGINFCHVIKIVAITGLKTLLMSINHRCIGIDAIFNINIVIIKILYKFQLSFISIIRADTNKTADLIDWIKKYFKDALIVFLYSSFLFFVFIEVKDITLISINLQIITHDEESIKKIEDINRVI